MVRRVYVTKKPSLAPESAALLSDCRSFLGLEGLTAVRVWNRYDAEGLSPQIFEEAKTTVFSEPPLDLVTEELDAGDAAALFAVEPLPGQFDQRSDSACQCIQLLSQAERPAVRSAKVYALYGQLSPRDVEAVKRYVINPVESREASLEKPETLKLSHPRPGPVETAAGFLSMGGPALTELLGSLGLAMDLDDLKCLQAYFRDQEGRDPTLTEIRVVDTYWSDHCRHTTFSTRLESFQLDDPAVKAAYDRYLDLREEVYGAEEAARRPQTLMDIATIAAKALKKRGLLPELDQSEEINACSIHVPAVVDGREQDWLLMFKNETHNHPTEIEPFGGAATCIGGCIRDPLSGRAYVHQAMRFTGAGDPRAGLEDTLPGKLPQRKLCQTAAAGCSSYGNQIGLATGLVSEVYHPRYIAKRLECGAVVAAVPAENVRREAPVPGDLVLLLGGRTGRDGIGGATGSSKSHDAKSLKTMASEVQKGNPPEERKLQRLFRRKDVTALIKRCNDFGAGGVSVAIGELADGLDIDLDAVRKKYDGLDGTELAISESQERMAVVVSPGDEAALLAAAESENLEAYRVAVVTESPRMVMRWRGQVVADLSRAFLNTNGAVKHAAVRVEKPSPAAPARPLPLREMAASLACASRRGLAERFDATIGAGSLLMPFGGVTQTTPAQVMAALLPVLPGQETDQGSVMAWGCDPEAMCADPYRGAYDAVTVSIAKLTAAGADPEKVYLTFQEFFEKLRDAPARWGRPFAALLGALDAQLDHGRAAIGGKDSMSGSFNDLDVPPTLISFAIAPIRAGELLSPEFKEGGRPVYCFGGGTADQLHRSWSRFRALARSGKVRAAWAVERGLAEAVMKMSFGNRVGFTADLEKSCGLWDQDGPRPGAIVAELTEEVQAGDGVVSIGATTEAPVVSIGADAAPVEELLALNEAVLEEVYPTKTARTGESVPAFAYTRRGPLPAPAVKRSRPAAVIPVFPGTNCEYDTAAACLRAGLEPRQVVLRNLTPAALAQSVRALEEAVRAAQLVILPGGFSGGDEPDGSAKFILSLFRSPRISDAVHDLLRRREGLMLGICNGFQALIKLGLVPYGEIRPATAASPTLTYNIIGRHQSRLVRTRVCSDLSPWLAKARVGEVYTVPISHGEGRFLASPELVEQLAERGQIAAQYVDLNGAPTMDAAWNPNGSVCAVEALTSPDGRVLGKMGHTERVGKHLYRNVPGAYDMGLFAAAAAYFQ